MKIKQKILGKIISTFLLVMIIPIILVSLYLNYLIDKNRKEKIVERLKIGKNYITSTIQINKLKDKAKSIKISEDQRLWNYLSNYEKSKNKKINKNSILQLMTENDISFLKIYNRDSQPILSIAYDYFNEDYLKVSKNLIQEGFLKSTTKEYLVDGGILIHSAAPIREYFKGDITTGTITNVLVLGKIISKEFIDNFKESVDLQISLFNYKDKNFTNVITTFNNSYGEALSGEKVENEEIKQILTQVLNSPEKGKIINEEIYLNSRYKSLYFPVETSDNRIIVGAVYQKIDDFTENNEKYYLVVLTLVMILSIIFASLFISRRLISPLNYLINGINKLSFQVENNIHFQKIDMKTDLHEFKVLTSSFNKMAIKVDTSIKEIDILKNYLKNIIDSMPSILIATDADGYITHWNKVASRIYSKKSEDVIGKILWKVDETFAGLKQKFHKVVLSEKEINYIQNYELDEVKKYNNISIYPLKTDVLIGIVIRIDDVTELENKKKQLIQSQKMETIGTLAGGLAHDFNNVLGGIVGTVSILMHKLNKGQLVEYESLKRYIKTIDKSGQRAADMVQQLLSLSRKKELTLVPIDLNKSIEHVMEICKNSFDKSIELQINLFDEQAMISGDPTQIEQVILNICVNASHAMTFMRKKDERRGGQLSVSLERIKTDVYFTKIYPKAKEDFYWNISIRDTGIGMPKETVEKIFDPFYTKKEQGKGTGLGLAMVNNIIDQHNGFLSVYSEVGVGTTFNIFIPEEKSEFEIVDYVKERDFELKGNGTILIIDDEPIMRNLAEEILSESGYRIMTARDGVEGVEKFKKHKNEIRLVMLDMVMPKKSGDETFYEIKKIDKKAKVLMASGFKEDKRIQDVLANGAAGFIQKPYTMQKLNKVIYRLLVK